MNPEFLSRSFIKLKSVGVNMRGSHFAVSDIGKLRAVEKTYPLNVDWRGWTTSLKASKLFHSGSTGSWPGRGA